MKWFKHLSKSLNNSFIAELIEKFGGDGYLVFFGTLELISDEFDIYNPGIVTLRIKKLTQSLQLSRQKTLKILRFCDQKAKENEKKDVAFFVNIENSHAIINCRKLVKLCDNHTLKLMKDLVTPLQSKNEVTLPKNDEKEKRKNCPIQKIIDQYHLSLPELPEIKSANTIGKFISARWREDFKRQDIKWWESFFINEVRTSDFLMGKVKSFRASLGWIVRPQNFEKILNGQYRNIKKELKEPPPPKALTNQDLDRISGKADLDAERSQETFANKKLK